MAQAVVQRACAKLRSSIGDEAVLRLNFTGDLQELLVALEVLQTVMEKTEMQLTRPSLAPVWFQEVRQAAYIIMDMVDELQDTRPPAATMVCMYGKSATRHLLGK
ncbi:hypothetical protein ACQ4PT_044261 [Festuca glaucescens]